MTTRFTKRTGGLSSGAFASLNLALHVGDNEETVRANRAIVEKQVGPTQYMNQVHGDRIAIIEQVTDEAPTADALITGIPGISLAVMVADCIPLLLKSKETVAAVHVGRRGLVNEISEELYNEVTSLHPFTQARTRNNSFSLDLPAGLRSVLSDEGIPLLNKHLCTFESDDHFSYRRENVTGRQIGVISL